MFEGLTPEQLKAIAMISKEASYKAGDVIMKEGEAADDLFIVLGGQVNVYVEVGAGRSDVTSVGEGSLMGWAALITDKRTASADARTDVETVVIDGNRLQDLLDGDHTMGYKIMQRLASTIYEHLRFTNYQLVSLE
jgi:CRP-like cAMP-binding protein